jgi:hypothetical protein
MILDKLAPKQSLNKAYLKEKVTRANIELFKKNLIEFLDGLSENEKESEEHVKNLITKFLDSTYYNGKNKINTSGRIDLAIYEDKKPVVIFEAKRPTSPDMVSVEDLNKKATHELMLYYLQERVDHGNIDIKYLIITNTYEWFIFDASVFDNLFYKNNVLMKEFIDWKSGRKARPDRDLFYNDIAKPFLKNLEEEIKFTWFDLKQIEKVAKKNTPKDDLKLIDLFKILSPVHLLKQPFANDSNSLDTKFYSELLHIIGLEEKKDGGKKIIQRKEKPDPASLLENAIATLVADDKLRKLPDGGKSFGGNESERLFNVALELCITWINRVLFLKLLEGQLLNYHSGDKVYQFLDFKNQSSFDELNKLFFEVLAKVSSKRPAAIQKKYSHIPYLNSSLFDFTSIEEDTILIKSLDDSLHLKIASSTVLKTENGKKREGELPTLQYLFEFLDAYDFSSEGKEEIQEENKTLINASVLGLIFEKINGYKDGSFFTPGFITMYMCRETIRMTVVQKFNETKKWKLERFEQLHNKIEDLKEANEIINSIKICDPAVGSGHFLVSALNEIIAIKSELGILSDRKGNRLREYNVEVVNDELIISIGHEEFFEYKPGNKESQRVQEALFHEKQTIIENCLFGVDLNPNSVKICRLRLWIELLKNAYYTTQSKFSELETLPNIDINIKQGNSLISRFPLDADLSKALKSIKYSIDNYRGFVNDYKNATDKEAKRGFEKLINQIKTDFRTEIGKSDPLLLRKNKLGGDLYNLLNQVQVFEPSEKEKKEREKKKLQIESDINRISSQIEEIENSAIYNDAFEWRFEFPEILDREGNFIGFDVILGNPPYGNLVEENSKIFFKTNYSTVEGPFEVYKFFIEMGLSLLKSNGLLCYISPDTWINLSYFKKLRNLITQDNSLEICSRTIYDVFDQATVDNNIYVVRKEASTTNSFYILSERLENIGKGNIEPTSNGIQINLRTKPKLIEKIESGSVRLSDLIDVWRGMSAYGAVNPKKPYNSLEKESESHRPLLNGGDIGKYSIKWAGEYIKYGDWLHRPRPSFIYDRPHILVQRIRNPRLKERIVATYDDRRFISSDGLSNLILKVDTEDPEFLKALTAILNSKVINYWFSFYYFDVNIKPEQLRQIPLKEMTKEIKVLLNARVGEILKIKEENANSNTEKIEKEIDEVVYQLYGLTKGEIDIIEQN